MERPKKRSQSDRAAPMRVLTRWPADLSSLPISGSEAARTRPLVVKKPHSKNWGIPEGNTEPHLNFAQNAAKEAFEETGVNGRSKPQTAGSYRAVKRTHGLKLVIEVYVYLLEVFRTARKWPEKGEREIKWCSPREAAILLREPVLAELCSRLDRKGTG
jgi:8-oxo-dGTP pyrophosphatase MutT (NUDIX family)